MNTPQGNVLVTNNTYNSTTLAEPYFLCEDYKTFPDWTEYAGNGGTTSLTDEKLVLNIASMAGSYASRYKRIFNDSIANIHFSWDNDFEIQFLVLCLMNGIWKDNQYGGLQLRESTACNVLNAKGVGFVWNRDINVGCEVHNGTARTYTDLVPNVNTVFTSNKLRLYRIVYKAGLSVAWDYYNDNAWHNLLTDSEASHLPSGTSQYMYLNLWLNAIDTNNMSISLLKAIGNLKIHNAT